MWEVGQNELQKKGQQDTDMKGESEKKNLTRKGLKGEGLNQGRGREGNTEEERGKNIFEKATRKQQIRQLINRQGDSQAVELSNTN